MTLEAIATRVVRAIDWITDVLIEIVLCVVLIFGAYALLDSRKVYESADSENYVAYRPTSEDAISFEELKELNPEVFAWITINDTPVDYPMAQADDNEKYINTSAEGEYTLSGAIFLDYRNSSDFDDFNSIIYGHHMEKKMMFGSLSDFEEEEYFDSHPYGNLFYNGADHGIEFFALVLTDAYDGSLFSPAVDGEENRQMYLDMIFSKAIYTRDLPVTTDDHIVVLSTCTSTITNGRYLLIGKLTDELHLPVRDEKPAEINTGTGVDARRRSVYGENPVLEYIVPETILIAVLTLFRKFKSIIPNMVKREKST